MDFVDGRREMFDAITMATGYRPALATLLPDFEQRFGRGNGPVKGDIQPQRDGLYLCGFNVVASGLLRKIGKEAKQIAASINRN